MEKHLRIILALAFAMVILSAALPGSAEENSKKDDQSIFIEERAEERPARRRPELNEEEINRILEGLRKRNPQKAKELAELRKKDSEKFQGELERHAREEFGEIVKERIEKWRQQRRTDFLKWLEDNIPDEAKELDRLKERGPDHYGKKYELVWRKYRYVFEESRRNPDLAGLLLEDVKLQNRQDELIGKIKTTKNKQTGTKLTAELEEVTALRYDVILRRRQMAYERLLKRLEDLRNQIREYRAEILKYQDPTTKEENVKQRVKELLEEKKKSLWD